MKNAAKSYLDKCPFNAIMFLFSGVSGGNLLLGLRILKDKVNSLITTNLVQHTQAARISGEGGAETRRKSGEGGAETRRKSVEGSAETYRKSGEGVAETTRKSVGGGAEISRKSGEGGAETYRKSGEGGDQISGETTGD